MKDTDTKLLGFQAGSDDEGEGRRKRRDFKDREFRSDDVGREEGGEFRGGRGFRRGGDRGAPRGTGFGSRGGFEGNRGGARRDNASKSNNLLSDKDFPTL